MTNRISNSAKRKRDILTRATVLFPGIPYPLGCSMNIKWAYASTKEQAVKDLIKDGHIVLRRVCHGGHKTVTTGFATEKGIQYLEKLNRMR